MQQLHEVPIRFIKGIGPKRASVFAGYGIQSVEDMLYYFPRRYEDRTRFSLVADAKEGVILSLKVKILSLRERRSFRKRGFSIMEVLTGDESGALVCVWFNRPYLKQYFKPGTNLIIYGKIEHYAGRLQMSAPDFEIVEDDAGGSVNTGRIVPVYSLPEGISQRYFRRLIKGVLDTYLSKINEFLPYDVRARHSLLNLAKSLLEIHFPENPGIQKQAYTRLAFEEFFLFQIPLVLRKLFRKKERKGISQAVDGDLTAAFAASLPFALTPAQKRVIGEIKADMKKPEVMQRLLQGDVGSGKTIVAVYASVMAVQGGYQAVFIVPTEILARQHFEKISCQLSVAGCRKKKIEVGLLLGSLKAKDKEKIYRQIREGDIDIVIGTHVLLGEGIKFKNLGLVVIDEQHKFGVEQRALLTRKGFNPDILVMTATPIPRTLAFTLYGDMDVSVIDELPPGRGRIQTLNFSDQERERAYQLVREQVRAGNQAYIIYPVIEESFALDIEGARTMYEQLKESRFKEFRLGLVHGRLKQKDQDEIMRRFKNKELDILIATTVLEVGIDIPSATCMVVEHAERFGLSQLHQLRGRVGRGQRDSFCILLAESRTETAQARMQAMVKYSDGFRIAEEDLKIRGPGEFFGERQHGLSELRIANPLTQMHLLKRSREEAVKLIGADPCLGARQNQALKAKLLQRFPEYEKFVLVG
ncbi:MAG: ATP-dependent DNA helicase RecG [Candidatus Omnitrophica bacterium]|nr:ATP-dependent DNA helicase RecG [Candidatus Omnitrophota bacterium]